MLIAAGVAEGSLTMAGAGVGAVVAFFVLVVWHARVLSAQQQAEVRQRVHERHVQRITGEWVELPAPERALLPDEHPYASDVDLLGSGSLAQRIDCTHTRAGERTLARWLGGAADADTIAARQAAAKELAPDVELRQELEAGGMGVSGDEKLDPSPFLDFVRREPFFPRAAWLVPVMHVLPVITIGLALAGYVGAIHGALWLLGLLAQGVVVMTTGKPTVEAFDLVAARRGYVESFQRMLVAIERSQPESKELKGLRERLFLGGQAPSAYLSRLDRWAGFAELRHQFPLHLVANFLLMWDLHVLYRLESWSRDVGEHIEGAFEALGEVEALASLATLAHIEGEAAFPEIRDEGEPFEADALAHPLLPADTRVENDVHLRGPGTALIITGSNMAGKSTLLRAVGTNVALALAGGPVVAGAMRVPMVRLRASMRADDNLQRGASYFHAELTKLGRVVEEADDGPPVLFLLDELLRGTNARARHLGARAVLMHLLERGATGLVATHDVALSTLEDEHPDRIGNVHFTDVMQGGDMIFDYRLRAGVVRTSNALRLLRKAGIEVPEDDVAESAAPDSEAVGS